MSHTGSEGLSQLGFWRKLTLVALFGTVPMLCGIAWLKTLWRVRKEINDMPDGEDSENDAADKTVQ